MSDICEAGLTGCLMVATDKHHKKLRSRGGTDSKKNTMLVCRSCHNKIHMHHPGTKRFRTHSWQEEGQSEEEA